VWHFSGVPGMNQNNPFKKTENGDENGAENGQNADDRRSGPDGGTNGDVSELNREIRNLRDEVKRLREVSEPEPPDADFDCKNGECDGFAIKEVDAGDVTTTKPFMRDARPTALECPRCGEEMSPEEFVPVEEQETTFGMEPFQPNPKAAGRGFVSRLEEEGREDVLKEAEKSGKKRNGGD